MKRFLFNQLQEHLPKKQISLIVGARQVGKTTLLHQIQAEIKNFGGQSFFITLEDKEILTLLNENPKNLLQLIAPPSDSYRSYLLIDEIQYLEDPSNFLKYHYDMYQDKVKFIVTGSSSFYIDKKFRDSLAGRKRIFELSTMPLKEVLHFRQRDDLADALNEGPIPLLLKDELVPYFYEYLLFGGYPEVILSDHPNEKKVVLKELGDSYAKKDAEEAGLGNPDAYAFLMKLLADRTGSLLNVNSLAADVHLDNKTISHYLWVMQKSFHIDIVRPFYANLSSELRKMPKLYFLDLGLRNCMLGNFSPIGIRDDKGELLENYVYLLLKLSLDSSNIRFWRTQNKQEVDFVIQKDDGHQEAIEVKFSENSFRESKYTLFKNKYPEIPLSCIDIDTALTLVL